MLTVAWGLLIAALLHVICAGIAKAGSKDFSNNDPRKWLAAQTGYRARANAAQANTLEAQPFFFVAVVFALYTGANIELLQLLMGAWLLARIMFVFMYLRDAALLRSLVWMVALGINIAILFLGDLSKLPTV